MATINKMPLPAEGSPGSAPARASGRFLPAFLVGTLLAGTLPAVHAQVVVLGHAETGKYVVVSDRKDPSATAARIAEEKAPGGGWKVLLESTDHGYGSMFCLRSRGTTQFFIAAGKPDAKEAVITSRSAAIAAASGTGQVAFWCGSWKNTNKHLAFAASSERATLTRNYGGVVLTYTLGKTASGERVVHVRGRNTLPSTAATVRFVGVEGSAREMLVLQPGESFTMPLGDFDSFGVEVGRQAPALRAQKVFDGQVLEALREVVREQINTTGGQIRAGSFIGKRG